MAAILKKSTRKKLGHSWGYILLPVILWGWLIGQIGFGLLAIMSSLSLGFFLFQAKVPCGAQTRQRDSTTGEFLLCRNNAKGILGGCGQYQSHKWQNAKLMVSRSTWGRFGRSLIRRTSGQAAAVSAVGTTSSAIIALFALFVSLAKNGP